MTIFLKIIIGLLLLLFIPLLVVFAAVIALAIYHEHRWRKLVDDGYNDRNGIEG